MIITWSILAIVLLLAAWEDSRTHQIHILLTLGGITAGVVIHAVQGGWHGLSISIIGIVVGLLLPALLWKFAGMGEGDVLLFTAIGSLIGPGGVMASYFFTLVSILVYTIPEVIGKRKKKRHALAPWIAVGTVIGSMAMRFIFSF